ncbi:MAG: hypothetical protein M3Y22_09010 [Pseudomonadota bacterium]|nr:hypothetical protein [Pseudomonadota bacterium]
MSADAILFSGLAFVTACIWLCIWLIASFHMAEAKANREAAREGRCRTCKQQLEPDETKICDECYASELW